MLLPNSVDLDIMAVLDSYLCTSLNISKVDDQYRATAMRRDGSKWDVGFGPIPALALKDLLNASTTRT
jgi:hypothetical protein